VAAQAQLQSNEKKLGKEKLQLQWKKVAAATTRASFGDPVASDTLAMLCVFKDNGTLVKEYVLHPAVRPIAAVR
jgi:hypothetical protein